MDVIDHTVVSVGDVFDRILDSGYILSNYCGYHFGSGIVESDLSHVWVIYMTTVYLYAIVDNVLRVTVNGFTKASGAPAELFQLPTLWADGGMCYALYGNSRVFGIPNANYGLGVYTRTDVVSPSSVNVSSIVSDICQKSGLSAGQLDVTALTDTVTGYAVGNQLTARDAIDPLLNYTCAVSLESDSKLKFVKRSNA